MPVSYGVFTTNEAAEPGYFILDGIYFFLYTNTTGTPRPKQRRRDLSDRQNRVKANPNSEFEREMDKYASETGYTNQELCHSLISHRHYTFYYILETIITNYLCYRDPS